MTTVTEAVRTSATSATLAPLPPILSRVRERASAVDAHEIDIRPSLRELGEAGLLDVDLPDQALLVRELARECTSTAFCVWAHRTAVTYLARWGDRALREELLPDLLDGRRPAATAMATAFQAALGLRDLGVTATPTEDGVELHGTIPWASNLFAEGALVVLPARTESGRNLIVIISTDQPGVRLLPYPTLLALNATASTTVKLDGVQVPARHLLTDRFLDFLADVRPSFLLVQTALALGLADASLEAARPRLEGTNAVLAADHTELDAERGRLDAIFTRRLATPASADDELVRLRLHASELAVAATRHESTATGGAGYLAAAATARRLREAAFLPIQSPTEAQLRWELSRSA